MTKRIISILTMIAILTVSMTVTGFGADSRSVAEAAYGTPVIDGEIDEVWEKSNYYLVDNYYARLRQEYKGWFKVLWDEEKIYVLSRVYDMDLCNTEAAHYNDSVDIYIDEDRGYQTGFLADDYQIRSDYAGNISGNNYSVPIEAKTKVLEDGFYAEMAFPLYVTELYEGLAIGFEVQFNAAPSAGLDLRCYTWNCESSWVWNNTNCYGELVLKKAVEVKPFEEPKWTPPMVEDRYSNPEDPAVKYEMIEGVTSTFDSSKGYKFPILHADDYPCMEINNLAELIGGTVENGNTLVKNGIKYTYTAGSKLAEDKAGHIMLERAPSIQGGKLFVPLSSLSSMLYYVIEYNRFDKDLHIHSGTDYPEPQLTFYAKDFGAVGDGVHDDLHPILEAIDVAIASGVPAKVELEPNKTYLVGPRQDAQAILYFENVENFTLDGKGSEILLAQATNSPLDIVRCTNVKIQNLNFDNKELVHTQGTITAIDKEKHTFRYVVDEGHLLPADDAWVHHFWGPTTVSNPLLGGWSFGTVMDPVEDRIHLDRKYDEIFIKTVTPIEGREYELTALEGYYAQLNEAEVGDRFVLNTRFNTYDIGIDTLDGLIRTAVRFYYSGDIRLENVNFYQAHWNGLNMGFCWGRIFLTNVGVKTKPGRLMSCNSDTLHMWRCREGVVMDGCTFENNMDDHMNTKGESGFILEYDDYSYVIDYDLHMRVGDELLFMNAVNGGTVLGNAFIKKIEIATGQGWRVTVDRKVEGIVKGTSGLQATKVYNVNGSSRGNVVKNSTFRNSRRSPYLCKSVNTIFDNNTIENCGGTAFKGAPESAATGRREGLYPSDCTIRNNKMKYDGQIQPKGPIAVFADSTPMGGQAKINNVLIENNYIEANNPNNFIYVHSVKNLYMYNNTLVSHSETIPKACTPVVIMNSKVKDIDGLKMDFASDVNAAVTIAGCEVNEADVKNVEVVGENTAKPYIIR